MNNETLKEILKLKSVPLTSEEIEAIMNEELEKDPDEMDTDLIDLCLTVLENASSDDNDSDTAKPKSKKIKTKKILVLVAVLSILVIFAVTVSAHFRNVDADENVVTYCGDYYLVDLTDADDPTETVPAQDVTTSQSTEK